MTTEIAELGVGLATDVASERLRAAVDVAVLLEAAEISLLFGEEGL